MRSRNTFTASRAGEALKQLCTREAAIQAPNTTTPAFMAFVLFQLRVLIQSLLEPSAHGSPAPKGTGWGVPDEKSKELTPEQAVACTHMHN